MIRHKKALSVTENGQEVKVAVLKPSVKLDSESRKVYNKAWNEGRLSGGYFPQANIYKVAREMGLWNEEQETKLAELDARIESNLVVLQNGGVPLWGFKEGTAQNAAVQVVKDRMERLRLFAGINSLYEHTLEAYCETTRFNFLVSQSVIYGEDGTMYFKSLEDFLARSDDEDVVAIVDAAQGVFYPSTSVADQQRELPEIRFMLKYKMITDELKLIDRNGQNINLNGDVLEENAAEVVTEPSPFLDEDGSPIQDVSTETISEENNIGGPTSEG